MKILRHFLGGTLLFLLGVSSVQAQTKTETETGTERTFTYYRPTTRVTSITSGGSYMIYNTAFNNGTEDRTGFIGSSTSSGFSHTGASHPKPRTFTTTSNIYLWTITSGDDDCGYYFQSVTTGKYASATGTYTNDAQSLIYVQDWSSSSCPKPTATTFKTEQHDGTTVLTSSLAAESGIWTICGTSKTSNGQSGNSGDCWNGTTSGWTTWNAAHPYAIYEYETLTVTLPDNYPIPGKKYYIYCDNNTRQFFYNDNGTLKVTNEMTKDAKLYEFTCTSFDGTYHQLQNVSSGKYFGFKAFSDTGYNLTISDGYDNATHIKCVGADKFLVMNKNGNFDQSTIANYTKDDTNDFSANYVFVPVEDVALNNVTFNITIDIAPSQSSAAANLTYTINGNEGTKSISATQTETISLVNNSTLTVSSATLRGYDCTITKGGESYESGTEITLTAPGETVFNIAYTANAERVAVEVENEVTPVLARTGVGYPKADAASRTTLSDAADAAKTSEGAVSERLTSIATAITAYKSSTDDIQMPENGKAYTIANINWNGVKRYMQYAENGITFGTTDAGAATPFICRELSTGKYTFVCNAGKYLVWRGNSVGANGHKGYVDAFNYEEAVGTNKYTDWTQITIEKMRAGGYVNDAKKQADLFGYMVFKGRRDNTFNYTIIKTNGNYDQANAPFFNADYSSVIVFEEVDYANHPTLLEIQGNKISGIEGETHIGTFSAPFETEIPEGVRAYYASAANAETGITLQEITTGTVPANTGVIITANTDNPGYFAPATTVTALESNQLNHSAGAAHTIVENDYILATANSVTALYKARVGGSDLKMNKAFLNLGTSLSPAFMLNFDDALTGISSIESQADTNGGNDLLYDLSGRRIAQPLSSGIYIRNGKKVFVK